MRYRDRSPENYDRFHSELQIMLATAGFPGVLEILADIAQEYGDGEVSSNAVKSGIAINHSFFLSAAAQVDQVRENLEDLV